MIIERPTQILVRRRAALGDAIMSTGVVRELKRRYPNSDIDVSTEHVDVYANNPHVRRVLNARVVESNPAMYDIYINRSEEHTSELQSH